MRLLIVEDESETPRAFTNRLSLANSAASRSVFDFESDLEVVFANALAKRDTTDRILGPRTIDTEWDIRCLLGEL